MKINTKWRNVVQLWNDKYMQAFYIPEMQISWKYLRNISISYILFYSEKYIGRRMKIEEKTLC